MNGAEVAHRPDKTGVDGSNPSSPTEVRAVRCDVGPVDDVPESTGGTP